MAQAIVASFPVDTSYVPNFLENIIDKRVCEVALNTLERLLDWIFSRIYGFYNRLYEQKMARVHLFSDREVKLYDCTTKGIASVDTEMTEENGFVHVQKKDFINLNKKRVYFISSYVEMKFQRSRYMDYVVVKDDPRGLQDWYQIVFHEIPRPGNPRPLEVFWEVNTKVEEESLDQTAWCAQPARNK